MKNLKAWDYGPVLPSIYHEAKAFGSARIGRICFRGVPKIETGTTEDIGLIDAWKFLKDDKPADLIKYTHHQGGAWDKNYIPGARRRAISDKDIKDEYEALNRG